MIYKISPNEAFDGISKSIAVPAKIKASCILKCYPETPVFSDGGAVMIVFGERGFVFGKPASPEELEVFLRFNCVKTVEGDIDSLNDKKTEFSVMEADGKNQESERVKIEPAARLISKTFSLDFPSLYSDLCRRVNSSVGSVFGDSVSAAALHKSEYGLLLWGLSVAETERGKGKGKKIVKKVLKGANGKVLVVCKKELESFYEKCGFKKTGSVFEINVEEIDS